MNNGVIPPTPERITIKHVIMKLLYQNNDDIKSKNKLNIDNNDIYYNLWVQPIKQSVAVRKLWLI